MKLAALISGGKDSVYALYKAIEGNEIMKLISVESAKDSMFFHRQNIELVKLQAEALNLPLNYRKSKESEELEVLEKSIEEIADEIDGVVSGAIASDYQKDRIEKICDRFGLKSLTPLWQRAEEKMMKELIEKDFEVMITKVAAEGLGKEWLGRKLDKKILDELKEKHEKYGIHLSGEGGEFETLVLDAPIFRERIVTTEREKVWDGKTQSGFLKIEGEIREK